MSGQADELVEQDPYDELEEEAAGLLAAPNAERDLDARATVLIRRMRRVLKEHGQAIERTRAETREQVLGELRQARETEAAYRRLNVPETARALFAGVDVTDAEAMAKRAEELRAAGVTWSGQPAPPPPPPDPGRFLAAQMAMQAAEAGAGAPIEDSSLERRMLKMAQSPESYSDAQREAVVEEFNKAVRGASMHHTSGSLG
jgi:hypothetical protein